MLAHQVLVFACHCHLVVTLIITGKSTVQTRFSPWEIVIRLHIDVRAFQAQLNTESFPISE